MNIRSSVLAAALTGSIFALAPNVAQAQWPDVREAKAIAEEGFIYGLPIVMNYVAMYELAVDAKGSQFKAPFNQIDNMARVANYKDTAVVTPNSDTPILLVCADRGSDQPGFAGSAGEAMSNALPHPILAACQPSGFVLRAGRHRTAA
jgi:hypothetical protein